MVKKATKQIISLTTAAYILMISKPCIICCRRTTRMCWASRERVECRREDTSNFVAAILRCPLHRRPLSQRPQAHRRLRPRCLAEGGQRSQGAHLRQINLVVLDERCAMVCKNRTVIQLPAEFPSQLRSAFRGTGKSYDRDMQSICQAREYAISNQKRYTWYIPSTSF